MTCCAGWTLELEVSVLTRCQIGAMSAQPSGLSHPRLVVYFVLTAASGQDMDIWGLRASDRHESHLGCLVAELEARSVLRDARASRAPGFRRHATIQYYSSSRPFAAPFCPHTYEGP